MLGLIVFGVPETYHPVLLRNKARKLRKETGEDRWIAPMEKLKRSIPKTIAYSLLRPAQLLLLEPMCTNLCIFSAILLGILYLFFGAFPIVFEGNHNFTLSQTGLSFLGILIGMLLGVATDPFWHKNYVRLIKQREEATGEVGGSEPEYRLPPAIAGALLVPVGLFMFAVSLPRFCLSPMVLMFSHMIFEVLTADSVTSAFASCQDANLPHSNLVDDILFGSLDRSYYWIWYIWHGVS